MSPQEEIDALRRELRDHQDKLNSKSKILKLVADQLGQIRLDMKYLAFDLHATKRERDDYAQQLEDLLTGGDN